MIDIHKDHRVYLTKPKPYIPDKKSIRGRDPTKYAVIEKGIRVDAYAQNISNSKWEMIQVRDSSKGPILYNNNS